MLEQVRTRSKSTFYHLVRLHKKAKRTLSPFLEFNDEHSQAAFALFFHSLLAGKKIDLALEICAAFLFTKNAQARSMAPIKKIKPKARLESKQEEHHILSNIKAFLSQSDLPCIHQTGSDPRDWQGMQRSLAGVAKLETHHFPDIYSKQETTTLKQAECKHGNDIDEGMSESTAVFVQTGKLNQRAQIHPGVVEFSSDIVYTLEYSFKDLLSESGFTLPFFREHILDNVFQRQFAGYRIEVNTGKTETIARRHTAYYCIRVTAPKRDASTNEPIVFESEHYQFNHHINDTDSAWPAFVDQVCTFLHDLFSTFPDLKTQFSCFHNPNKNSKLCQKQLQEVISWFLPIELAIYHHIDLQSHLKSVTVSYTHFEQGLKDSIAQDDLTSFKLHLELAKAHALSTIESKSWASTGLPVENIYAGNPLESIHSESEMPATLSVVGLCYFYQAKTCLSWIKAHHPQLTTRTGCTTDFVESLGYGAIRSLDRMSIILSNCHFNNLATNRGFDISSCMKASSLSPHQLRSLSKITYGFHLARSYVKTLKTKQQLALLKSYCIESFSLYQTITTMIFPDLALKAVRNASTTFFKFKLKNRISHQSQYHLEGQIGFAINRVFESTHFFTIIEELATKMLFFTLAKLGLTHNDTTFECFLFPDSTSTKSQLCINMQFANDEHAKQFCQYITHVANQTASRYQNQVLIFIDPIAFFKIIKTTPLHTYHAKHCQSGIYITEPQTHYADISDMSPAPARNHNIFTALTLVKQESTMPKTELSPIWQEIRSAIALLLERNVDDANDIQLIINHDAIFVSYSNTSKSHPMCRAQIARLLCQLGHCFDSEKHNLKSRTHAFNYPLDKDVFQYHYFNLDIPKEAIKATCQDTPLYQSSAFATQLRNKLHLLVYNIIFDSLYFHFAESNQHATHYRNGISHSDVSLNPHYAFRHGYKTPANEHNTRTLRPSNTRVSAKRLSENGIACHVSDYTDNDDHNNDLAAMFSSDDGWELTPAQQISDKDQRNYTSLFNMAFDKLDTSQTSATPKQNNQITIDEKATLNQAGFEYKGDSSHAMMQFLQSKQTYYVGLFIINEQGQMLLSMRQDGHNELGFCGPGGHCNSPHANHPSHHINEQLKEFSLKFNKSENRETQSVFLGSPEGCDTDKVFLVHKNDLNFGSRRLNLNIVASDKEFKANTLAWANLEDLAALPLYLKEQSFEILFRFLEKSINKTISDNGFPQVKLSISRDEHNYGRTQWHCSSLTIKNMFCHWLRAINPSLVQSQRLTHPLFKDEAPAPLSALKLYLLFEHIGIENAPIKKQSQSACRYPQPF